MTLEEQILTSWGWGCGCAVEVSGACREATGRLSSAFAEVDVVLAFSGWNSFDIDSYNIIGKVWYLLTIKSLHIYECLYRNDNAPTLWRWAGKLKIDGITPSLSRTIWPVMSKSSLLKCSLQRTEELLLANPSLLTATSHFFLKSLSLGNLQNEKTPEMWGSLKQKHFTKEVEFIFFLQIC